MTAHSHYYHCSLPDHNGKVSGSCECGTNKTFNVPQSNWVNSGRPAASIQGALKHRAEVAQEIREIERGLMIRGW